MKDDSKKNILSRKEAVEWINELQDDDFYCTGPKETDLMIKDTDSVINFLKYIFKITDEEFE